MFPFRPPIILTEMEVSTAAESLISAQYGLITTSMFSAGLVCGMGKFLCTRAESQRNLTAFRDDPLTLFAMVIESLIAAFMTPLLLNMLSSDLVPKTIGANGDPPDVTSLLVFFGFALVTGWAGTDMIDLLSQRVLMPLRKELNAQKEENKETKKLAQAAEEKIEIVANRRTEPDALDQVGDGKSDAIASASRTDKLTAHQCQILSAMYKSTFDFRSVRGVAREAKLSESTAMQELENLKALGLVMTRQSRGHFSWFLTSQGIQYAKSITDKTHSKSS